MNSNVERWMRRGPGAWIAGTLVGSMLFLGTAGAPAFAAAGGPSGTVTCNAWVRDGGSDDPARGSKAAPYATLAYALAAPQAPASGLRTICLPAGSTLTLPGTAYNLARSSTVVAGETGGTRPRVVGRLTVTGNDVTIRDLDVSHTTRFASTLRIWGDRVSLLDSSIAATQGTCVEVGYLDAEAIPVDSPGESGYHKVHDVVIEGNDIGPCARSDGFLSTWSCNYSGLPGIYSQWVERLDIFDNVIHDTALRGIQLFPKNKDVLVQDNLLRRNSIAMNVGTSADDLEARKQHQATNILIESNVFADQTSAALAQQYPNIRGAQVPPAGGTCAGNKFLSANPPDVTVDDQATENAVTGFPTTNPTVTVRNNCGEDVTKNAGNLFTWTGNVNTAASFEAGSDRLAAGTDCVGRGPEQESNPVVERHRRSRSCPRSRPWRRSAIWRATSSTWRTSARSLGRSPSPLR